MASSFEDEREANIQRNRLMLEALGIPSATATLSSFAETDVKRKPDESKQKAKNKKKRFSSNSDEMNNNPPVLRRSLRQRGIDGKAVVSEPAVDYAKLRQEIEEKRRKRPEGPIEVVRSSTTGKKSRGINLGEIPNDIISNDDDDDDDDDESAEEDEGDKKVDGDNDDDDDDRPIDADNIGWIGVKRVMSSIKPIKSEAKESKSSNSKYSLLDVTEDGRIKMTPSRICSIAFHPSTAPKLLAFAGDKHGHVAGWSIDLDDESKNNNGDDPVFTFRSCHRVHVLSMLCSPLRPESLITGSRDGSVRALDLNTGVSTEWIVPPPDEYPDSVHSLSTADGNSFYLSSTDGSVMMIDRRASGAETLRWEDVHSVKIGGLAVNPTGTLLATASNDRTVKVWDLRFMSNHNVSSSSSFPRSSSVRRAVKVIKSESQVDDGNAQKVSAVRTIRGGKDKKLSLSTPLAVFSHNKAAQSVGFSPTMPNRLASSAWDDTVKIWDDVTTASSSSARVVRHNNQTGRWVTNFKLEWNPDGSMICIGGMGRTVDLIDPDSGKVSIQLHSDNVTAIPALNQFHPVHNTAETPMIFSCNASGYGHLWKVPKH